MLFPQPAAADILQGPRDRAVPVGQPVTFQCNATAEPVHTVVWEVNGAVVTSSEKYSISVTSTLTTITVTNLEVSDMGSYTCVVMNVHGNDTASALLTVQSMFSKIVVYL